MIYLAFYKNKREVTSLKTLGYRLFDEITKLTTRGKYSHCEIAILKDDKYTCYSASARDCGVRRKTINVSDSKKWDLVAVDSADEQKIVAYFEKTQSAKYDYLGAVGLVLPFTQNKGRYFCSEWCFNALFNSEHGWRFSPNDLAAICCSEKTRDMRRAQE